MFYASPSAQSFHFGVFTASLEKPDSVKVDSTKLQGQSDIC